MATHLRMRLGAAEDGFSLIELIVVVLIMGVLLAIATPAYLSAQDKAAATAAEAQVRTVTPDINRYLVDHYSSYTGIGAGLLKHDYDASISHTRVYVEATGHGASFYVCTHVKGFYSEQVGADGSVADASKTKAGLPSGGGDCSL